MGLAITSLKNCCHSVSENLVVIQLFQLTAEVSNQFILGMQRQIGIALLAQQPDKLFFQFRLALVAVRAHLGGFIGGNNGIFIGSRNDIGKRTFSHPPFTHTNLLLLVLLEYLAVFFPDKANAPALVADRSSA